MDGGASSSTTAALPPHRHSVKRSFSSMASEYRSDSPDSLFVPQHDTFEDERPSQRRRLNPTLTLPRRPTRFVGDGYDYRRPMVSAEGVGRGPAVAATAAVIDLTADDDNGEARAQALSDQDPEALPGPSRAQRLPRFHGRNIIDVESEGEDVRSERQTNVDHNDLDEPHDNQRHPHFSILRRPQRAQPADLEMDDLEFLEERPLSRAQTASRTRTPAATAHRSITPFLNAINIPIDLTEEDDEVVHLESRARPRANLERPTATAGVGTRRALMDRLPMFDFDGRLFSRLVGNARTMMRAQQDVHHNHLHEHHRNVGTHNDNHNLQPELHLRIHAPVAHDVPFDMLDYDVVGFDMFLPGGNRPPTPKYEPPQAANTGFTRSPGEDEVVVCPNCGNELAMGDSEEKQEIWVIKKCGHAYCGVCTHNRAKGSRSSRKGKGKAAAVAYDGPPPFKTCVVDGCKESASNKAMVHVFLGS